MHELIRFTDNALLGATSQLSAHDHRTTASLVAHLAEIDVRRLYLALGHPSMFAYVVETLHYSESAAYRRIQAARTARRFPRLFELMAEARLHLAAVCQLAPHLTDENFEELVGAASQRSKVELERWLEVRFAPPLLVAAEPRLVPGRVVPDQPAAHELVPGRVPPVVPPIPVPPPAIAPHVVLRLALPPAMEARLRYAQALLGHAVPGGDPVEVFGRALEALIRQLERRKFARTERPRKPRAKAEARAAGRPRTVPAHVKREVWQRDEGRCAFVSAQGRRCSSHARLEFDHSVPVARGGTSRAEDLRLLCRAHNQFEAERVFGRAFMQRRREAARGERSGRSTRPGTS
jgi:5-methylcytosine-specific restriction endonuclease McrA